MRYFFTDAEKIKKILENNYLFLFLDCDGTLAPIVNLPHQAVIAKETKRILNLLSKSKNCRVAIISGRSLGDLKKKVNLRNIIYSGNHGLQIQGPKLKYELPLPLDYRKALPQIKAQLKKKLSGIKGILLEDKKFSLALHFRLADKHRLPLVKTVFHEITAVYLVRDQIKVKSGKQVLEVRPPLPWDKGKAVLWLLARQEIFLKDKKFFPIYIGDDLTDEDAFAALKNKGLTVLVGLPGSSQAQYYIKDVQEVKDCLKFILNITTSKNYA